MATKDAVALQNLLGKWNATTKDEQKLAILMLVVKILSRNNEINAEDLVDSQNIKDDQQLERIQQVYDAIGFNFVDRLYSTSKVPEGCSPTMFQELAMSLFATYCRVGDIAKEPLIRGKISTFGNIIYSFVNEETESPTLCMDAFECLLGIVMTPEGNEDIVNDPQLISCIFDAVHFDATFDYACALLERLLSSNATYLSKSHTSVFVQGCSDIACEISERQDDIKFRFCQFLTTLLSYGIQDDCEEIIFALQNDARFFNSLRKLFSDVFLSKLTSEYRHIALLLNGEICRHFSIDWLVPDKTKEESGKALAAAIALSCVETRMIIDDSSVEEMKEQEMLLMACFLTLEKSIQLLSSSSASLPFASFIVNHTKISINDVMKALMRMFRDNRVVSFMKENGNDRSSYQLICGCVRIFSVWLSEDTENLREEVLETLPFLLAYCDIKNVYSEQVLVFALPGLLQLTSEEDYINVLFRSETQQSLVYFMNKWKDASDNSDCVNVLNIILNICIVAPEKIKKESQLFAQLFQTIVQIDIEDKVARSTYIVVGLFLFRLCHRSLSNEDAEAFFQNHSLFLIELFKSVSTPTKVINEDDDEMLVNFSSIALQNLSTCVSQSTKLRDIIFGSLFFPSLLKWLNSNPHKIISEDIEQLVHNLLIETAKSGQNGRNVLIANNGRQIALDYAIMPLLQVLTV